MKVVAGNNVLYTESLNCPGIKDLSCELSSSAHPTGLNWTEVAMLKILIQWLLKHWIIFQLEDLTTTQFTPLV